MQFVLGTAWELDRWMDVDKTLDKAAVTKKYESAHIRTNWLKMFMDGTVESGTVLLSHNFFLNSKHNSQTFRNFASVYRIKPI